MKIANSKILRTYLNKWRKAEFRTPFSSSSDSESCCKWGFRRSSLREESFIPRDVPRGHLAVYVGENCRRFVIKIALLDHPLFQALLDLAQDEYDFTSSSKLCIPCDENMFIEVIRCAVSPQDQRVYICF